MDGLARQILYPAAAWTGEPMKRRLEDTDPLGLRPGSDLAGAGLPNVEGDITEPDPRMPLRAPTDDAQLRSLLDGLSASRAPAPVETATTDGDLAAKYAAGPGSPAPRYPTPAPQASVIVGEATGRAREIPTAPEHPEHVAASRNVHGAVTMRIDRPVVPPEGDAQRSGVRRGLLIGVPTGFALGTLVAAAVALLVSRAGGTNGHGVMAEHTPEDRPGNVAMAAEPQPANTPFAMPAAAVASATPVDSVAPVPPVVSAATAATPASARASTGAGDSPAASKRVPRGAPAQSASGKPAPRTTAQKNTMVNEL